MRAIIIGVDSTIGRALCFSLIARGDRVTGTTRRQPSGAGVYLDLTDERAGEADLPQADVAFFCAAVTRFADCRAQPEVALRVNVITPVALAARLVRSGTRVVLLSTSAVLDCAVPRMLPERPLAPSSSYGRYKAAAEDRFLALGAGAAVLRLSKVLTPESKLFSDWIAALCRGERIRAFADLRFSPIRVDDAVGALTAIADRRESGLFQVSGADDISYADAARHLASGLGVGPDLIDVCPALESGIPAEELTAYTSLDTQRLSALSAFVPPDPRTVLDEIFGRALRRAGAPVRKPT